MCHTGADWVTVSRGLEVGSSPPSRSEESGGLGGGELIISFVLMIGVASDVVAFSISSLTVVMWSQEQFVVAKIGVMGVA